MAQTQWPVPAAKYPCSPHISIPCPISVIGNNHHLRSWKHKALVMPVTPITGEAEMEKPWSTLASMSSYLSSSSRQQSNNTQSCPSSTHISAHTYKEKSRGYGVTWAIWQEFSSVLNTPPTNWVFSIPSQKTIIIPI